MNLRNRQCDFFNPAKKSSHPQKPQYARRRNQKKNISGEKAAHLATRKEFRKISASYKRHQKNLALYRFLTLLYYVFRFAAKCETLHFQQQRHVAAKSFRKVLDCWSLVWSFCPSIANLFCLQVKRIRLKLNRTRKSTEK